MSRRFLFTVDLDWIPGSAGGVHHVLELANQHSLPLTAFVTGRFAVDHPALIQALWAEGHEVGTHGWSHGLDWSEDLRTMSYEEQRTRLEKATNAVGSAMGVRPTMFRAPNLHVGERLLRVLEGLEYEIDSSVPAGRYDGLIGGRIGFLSYYSAPREPYHPDPEDFGSRGDSEIVEVPPSAFVLPMVMSTLRRAHPAVCRWVARRVFQRSSVLNFYCHPWEFVEPEKRPFPPEAPAHCSRNTGPQWIEPVSDFIEEVLSWGCRPASLTEVARDADRGRDG